MKVWAKRARALVIASAAIVGSVIACANLQPMQASECGNGVLEDGEDCDLAVDPSAGPFTSCGPPDEARACRYICGGMAACPTGWGCGLDGVCRRATGLFRSGPRSNLLGARGWAVGRVDEDSLPDLLVALDRDLQVQLGDGDGGFSLAHTLRLPEQEVSQPPPALTDLDGDGRLDAAVLVRTGLLTVRAGPGGEPVPDLGAPLKYGEQQDARFVAAQIEGVQGEVVFALVEPLDEAEPLAAVFLWPISPDDELLNGPAVDVPESAGLSLSGLAGSRIPRANLDGDPAGPQDHLALAFKQSPTVRILETRLEEFPKDGMRPGAFVVKELELPFPVNALGVSFADVDGDGLIDLLACTDDKVFVAHGTGDEYLLASPVEDTRFQALIGPGTSLPGLTVEDVPCPLAAADFDGDGRTDYVGQNGVFLTDPSTETLRQVDWRKVPEVWDQVVIVDLNGDGLPDIAASADVPGIVTVRGVDLLGNDGYGSFSRGWVNTEGGVRALVTGDFNGDLVGDVAMVEVITEGSNPNTNRVSVAFGQPFGLPTAAEGMGDFERTVRQIVPGRLATGSEGSEGSQHDPVSDLLVSLGKQEQSNLITILWGETAQQLFAPTYVGSAPRLVVPGRFGGSATDLLDLLVVTEEGDQSRASLYSGTGELLHEAVDLPFDAACVLSMVADLDNDDIDEWLVVSAKQVKQCSGEDDHSLWVTNFESGIQVAAARRLYGPFAAPRDTIIEDFDGDGFLDLTISFMGVAAAARGVTVYWNDQGQIDGADATNLHELAGEPPGALLGALNADDDPTRELVGFTSNGVLVVDFGADRFVTAPPQLALDDDSFLFDDMRAADLTGDGVDDLLLQSHDPKTIEVLLGVDHLGICVPDESAPLIYLNRNGGSFRSGEDDSSTNSSSIVPADAELLPLAGGVAWNNVVECVQNAFAGFRVRVTDEDPGAQPHLEVVVTGSTAEVFGFDPRTTSMSPHLCDGVPAGIGFVFGPASLADPQQMCAAAAASAGIMLGLEWTVQCEDIMGFDLSCSERAFLDQDVPCGTTEPTACECGGSTQNSYERLLELFGEASCLSN